MMKKLKWILTMLTIVSIVVCIGTITVPIAYMISAAVGMCVTVALLIVEDVDDAAKEALIECYKHELENFQANEDSSEDVTLQEVEDKTEYKK